MLRFLNGLSILNKFKAFLIGIGLGALALVGTTVTYTLSGSELAKLQAIGTDLPPSLLNIFLTIVASMLGVIVVYFAFRLVKRYI